jgi:hypothetical protein
MYILEGEVPPEPFAGDVGTGTPSRHTADEMKPFPPAKVEFAIFYDLSEHPLSSQPGFSLTFIHIFFLRVYPTN